jgi:hypothetical protein
MKAEPHYTNGRIRVRPEQIEYLDNLLHQEWVRVSAIRSKVKEKLPTGLISGDHDGELITLMNRELRLIQSIQEEVKRTKADMDNA